MITRAVSDTLKGEGINSGSAAIWHRLRHMEGILVERYVVIVMNITIQRFYR
jgi:hypothetical protein